MQFTFAKVIAFLLVLNLGVAIDNCAIQIGAGCFRCALEFSLTSANTCAIASAIANCDVYAQQENLSWICAQCAPGFAWAGNACRSIEFCLAYDVVEGFRCSECVQGKAPTGDGQACLSFATTTEGQLTELGPRTPTDKRRVCCSTVCPKA